MGSWNGTCGVTQLPIFSGDETVLFLLSYTAGRMADYHSGHCYSNDIWSPRTIQVYGKYDDYGRIEEWSPPWHTDFIVERLRCDLVEKEQGENPFHDIPVKRDALDFKLILDAIRESRLEVQQDKIMWANFTDRSKTLPIGFMMVHRFVFEQFATTTFDDYFKEGGHTAADTRADAERFYEAILKLPHDEGLRGIAEDGSLPSFARLAYEERNVFASMFKGSEGGFDTVWVRHGIRDYAVLLGRHARQKHAFEHPEVTEIVNELTKFYHFFCTFSLLRRTWAPQAGLGSQTNELPLHRALAERVTHFCQQRQQEWDAS